MTKRSCWVDESRSQGRNQGNRTINLVCKEQQSNKALLGKLLKLMTSFSISNAAMHFWLIEKIPRLCTYSNLHGEICGSDSLHSIHSICSMDFYWLCFAGGFMLNVILPSSLFSFHILCFCELIFATKRARKFMLIYLKLHHYFVYSCMGRITSFYTFRL